MSVHTNLGSGNSTVDDRVRECKAEFSKEKLRLSQKRMSCPVPDRGTTSEKAFISPLVMRHKCHGGEGKNEI